MQIETDISALISERRAGFDSGGWSARDPASVSNRPRGRRAGITWCRSTESSLRRSTSSPYSRDAVPKAWRRVPRASTVQITSEKIHETPFPAVVSYVFCSDSTPPRMICVDTSAPCRRRMIVRRKMNQEGVSIEIGAPTSRASAVTIFGCRESGWISGCSLPRGMDHDTIELSANRELIPVSSRRRFPSDIDEDS